MSEATAIRVFDFRKLLKDPSEAPKGFMIVMANKEEDGMHIFVDKDDLAGFAADIYKMIHDG